MNLPENAKLKILVALEPEIDRKCEELKEKRKAKRQGRLFLLLCFLMVLIPTILALLGVSLMFLLIPILFTSLGILLLLPALLKEEGEKNDERI